MLQDYKVRELSQDASNQPVAAVASLIEKEYAIEFDKVSRLYRLHHEPKLTLQDWAVHLFNKKSSYEDFWALKDVSFKLERGKTLGIIGQNGAGKSTLLKLATHIIPPTSGTIRVNGRVSAMLELGTGFHPDLSARDNVYLNGAFYGFSRKQMDERYERILEFSELGKFIDTPVKYFSSGMYMRLGFAIAITVNPDILIIDEVLAVGDAAFGRKCHQAIEELKQQSKAMLFVSHSAAEVSRFCDEVIYLAKGQIVARGKPGDVLDEYIVASMGPTYFTSRLKSQAETEAEAVVEGVPAAEPIHKNAAPVALSSEEESLEEEMLASSLLPLVNTPPVYKVRPGLSQLADSWHFNMQQARSTDNPESGAPSEYYLAVLNPQATPLEFDLTAYRHSNPGLGSDSEGLRVMPAGHFSLAAHQMLLLNMEQESIFYTRQLSLKAALPVAAELVKYQSNQALNLTGLVPGNNAALRWYFPFCDVRFDNECQLKLFNSNEQLAEFKFWLYSDEAGIIPESFTFQVEPISQLTLDLRQAEVVRDWQQRHGKPFYGGVVIEADRPVLAECQSLQNTSPRHQLIGRMG